MKQGAKPADMPAPQLPNIPISQDDPFHLDSERSLPSVLPAEEESDSQPQTSSSGGVTQKTKPVPDEEPELFRRR